MAGQITCSGGANTAPFADIVFAASRSQSALLTVGLEKEIAQVKSAAASAPQWDVILAAQATKPVSVTQYQQSLVQDIRTPPPAICCSDSSASVFGGDADVGAEFAQDTSQSQTAGCSSSSGAPMQYRLPREYHEQHCLIEGGNFHLHTKPVSQYAQEVGRLGEMFVCWLLQDIWKLPGFDESCWHSSNRQHWQGPKKLPPPDSEPSYDFYYNDTEGKLSGKPGTRCFIECKATSRNATSKSSSTSTWGYPITKNEWVLAWKAHRKAAAGELDMYIIVCVDRVRQKGGPRLAAVLRDPVGTLKADQLWVEGNEMVIGRFPYLPYIT